MHEEKGPVRLQSQRTVWAKRAGLAGFVFFLLKGVLWLILPVLLGGWSMNG